MCNLAPSNLSDLKLLFWKSQFLELMACCMYEELSLRHRSLHKTASVVVCLSCIIAVETCRSLELVGQQPSPVSKLQVNERFFLKEQGLVPKE